jgi:hypothetical protein
MPVFKGIRVKAGYSKMSHSNFFVFVMGIYTSMLGKPKFPGPPVDLAVLKATLDKYNWAIAAACDGSKTINVGERFATRRLGQNGETARLLR